MIIPESHRDLLLDSTKALAFLATTMKDGTPQVTPVWFDVEDDLIRVNTARGRVKDVNMTARPHVALAISDPKNLYRYLQIRGEVASIEEKDARDHIDLLAKKYLGLDSYSGSADDIRVIYRINPRSTSTMG